MKMEKIQLRFVILLFFEEIAENYLSFVKRFLILHAFDTREEIKIRTQYTKQIFISCSFSICIPKLVGCRISSVEIVTKQKGLTA